MDFGPASKDYKTMQNLYVVIFQRKSRIISPFHQWDTIKIALTEGGAINQTCFSFLTTRLACTPMGSRFSTTSLGSRDLPLRRLLGIVANKREKRSKARQKKKTNMKILRQFFSLISTLRSPKIIKGQSGEIFRNLPSTFRTVIAKRKKKT